MGNVVKTLVTVSHKWILKAKNKDYLSKLNLHKKSFVGFYDMLVSLKH